MSSCAEIRNLNAAQTEFHRDDELLATQDFAEIAPRLNLDFTQDNPKCCYSVRRFASLRHTFFGNHVREASAHARTRIFLRVAQKIPYRARTVTLRK